LKVQRDGRQSKVEVVADRDGVVSHAGAALLAEAADRLGLSGSWRDASAACASAAAGTIPGG
jgi:hypothetical protein